MKWDTFGDGLTRISYVNHLERSVPDVSVGGEALDLPSKHRGHCLLTLLIRINHLSSTFQFTLRWQRAKVGPVARSLNVSDGEDVGGL